jgi:predicted RNA methylase
MVFDGLRNATYFRALKKIITPDTTLMDLGAGLGMHGLNAATLGAAAVHLVEPSPVLEVARKIAAENDLQNIHCHQCRAEELQLDERVDILVSVFTGNFLLTEDLLPSLFYARDKFLKPGGQMIPDRACMEVVPVSAPDYYQKNINAWNTYPEYAADHSLPALDHQSVRPFAANTMYYDTAENFQAMPLSAPVPLMELDFTTATSAGCDSLIEVIIEQDGICHGWLGWFQVHLLDEWLSTGSDAAPTHWRQVFLPLESPLQVTAGEQLRFALKRPEFGEWTWTTEHSERRQRQSTFLSQPLSPERLLKASDKYQPNLSERGDAARWLLAKMTGDAPVAQLAIQLQAQFPTIFTSDAEALKFTKHLAERYS